MSKFCLWIQNNYTTNQTLTWKTLTVLSAPQEASCIVLEFLGFSWVFQAMRFTAATWHANGSNLMTRLAVLGAVVLTSLVLLTEILHSSITPLSIPTARNPWFFWRSRPSHDRAVTLLLNGGKARICLTEDLFSTAQILTVLSLEPVANSWPNGFQEHDQIILLWASCLAISW